MHEPADLTWTQTAAALVQNKDVRVTEHRRGHRQPLAHAEGEVPDSPPSVHGEPGLGQDAHRRVPGQPGRCHEDAVGPEQGRDLARRRDGAHLVDRENVPERLGEVVQLNSTWQGSGHGDVSELR